MIRKFFIVLISFLIIFFLVFASPLFSIRDVEINGNEKFSQEEIEALANVHKGMNIVTVFLADSEEKLYENKYIKYANTSVKLPDTVVIDIIERKTCGYVPYMGAYLYIDQDGYVLESKSTKDIPRPVAVGLNFKEFTVGQPLVVENSKSFDVVMTMSKLLINYKYLDYVKEMNIADIDDIHLYVDNIDVSFGDINDADRKLRTVIESLKEISRGAKGVFHIENMDMVPYFSYMQ